MLNQLFGLNLETLLNKFSCMCMAYMTNGLLKWSWDVFGVAKYASWSIATVLKEAHKEADGREVYIFSPDAVVSLSSTALTVRSVARFAHLPADGRRTLRITDVDITTDTPQAALLKMLEPLTVDQRNILRCSPPIVADSEGEGERSLADHVGLHLTSQRFEGYGWDFSERKQTDWGSFDLPKEVSHYRVPTVSDLISRIDSWMNGDFKHARGYELSLTRTQTLRLWRRDVCVLLSWEPFTDWEWMRATLFVAGEEAPTWVDVPRIQDYKQRSKDRDVDLARLFSRLTVQQVQRLFVARGCMSDDLTSFYKTNFVPRDPLPRMAKGLSTTQLDKIRADRCSGKWLFVSPGPSQRQIDLLSALARSGPAPPQKAVAKAPGKPLSAQAIAVKAVAKAAQKPLQVKATGKSAQPHSKALVRAGGGPVQAAKNRIQPVFGSPELPQDARYLLPKLGVVVDKAVKATRAQAVKQLMARR